MAKRLFMTEADYVVIALSPALIMTLVGSLVFFLIDILYVGDYQIRLTYAFGWFVFATVLISRIAIEMGSHRAVLFGLPLGLVMFLFLVRFVEHTSPLSHVINLGLMGLVWWCAHKLTWDSTVIDDDEDASGAGLMQVIGVDEQAAANDKDKRREASSASGASDNELFDETEASKSKPWWKRLMASDKRHMPGVWVLYFSLAALPLFGVLQTQIPVSDVGRRRYAFGLLLVYVASALSLLVTTSFLNLRRYLRQRRLEMPLQIAGTWIATGAVIIVCIMVVALLIPRPSAEVAISQVPWKAKSSEELSASRKAMLRDGGEEQGEHADATGGEKTTDEGQPSTTVEESEGSPVDSDQPGSRQSPTSENRAHGSGEKNRSQQPTSGNDAEAKPGEPSGQAESKGEAGDRGEKSEGRGQKLADEAKSSENQSSDQQANDSASEKGQGDTTASDGMKSHSSPQVSQPSLVNQLTGWSSVLKLLVYALAAIGIAFLIWHYREQIRQAIADLLRALRDLFGGGRSAEVGEEERETRVARIRSFSEFRDPFAGGQHSQWPPEEFVRYTFSAFEAWASDRGLPRTPDCTPQELVAMAVDPSSSMHIEARKLVHLYSQVAYASQRVPREAATELRTIWQLMRMAGTEQPINV